MLTKKAIVDDILNLVEKFSRSDDSRKDETWLSWKIDHVRSQMIVASYSKNRIIDRSWLTDMGVQDFHSTNFADDPTVGYCCSDISKLTIPSVISLKDDLGVFSLLSACGTKEYTRYPLQSWKIIPKSHIRSKFNYYDRINTALYVNKEVEKLRPILILEFPEDGYIVDSTPITSGNIASGTSYTVKGTIIYAGTAYKNNETFTGGATTTFSGNGKVYLTSVLTELSETKAYPVSADMARDIVLEICTKEFRIEQAQISDVKNNSVDDEQLTGEKKV